VIAGTAGEEYRTRTVVPDPEVDIFKDKSTTKASGEGEESCTRTSPLANTNNDEDDDDILQLSKRINSTQIHPTDCNNWEAANTGSSEERQTRGNPEYTSVVKHKVT
jgi:hypothetical protein